MREKQPCGTWAAAKRHRKAGEELCEPCREAERLQASLRYNYDPDQRSRQLARVTERTQRASAEARATDPALQPRPCIVCAAIYTPRNSRQKRCPECVTAGRRPLSSRSKRTQETARLRARLQSQTPAGKARSNHRAHMRRVRTGSSSGDVLSWRTIGERDGWTCWLCGDPVDPLHVWVTGGGRLNALHPSLDHVVPLSQGGDHLPTNARLAHWLCNVLRGATPIPQMLESA